MRFVKISSPAAVEDYLVTTLTRHLEAGKRVLWLVPGGSSIAVAAAASRRLAEQAAGEGGLPLGHLTVTLTDERYGPVGHPDSNWRQLDEAGFTLPGATLLPVLTGVDMDATVEEFAAVLKNHLGSADVAVGFFGIGPDGHTAGILPHSPAVVATKFAAGYDAATIGAAPFKRVTMTFPAVQQLDEAVVYAVGEAKRPVFDGLASGDIPLDDQPAQVLKHVPKLTIFNDQVGE